MFKAVYYNYENHIKSQSWFSDLKYSGFICRLSKVYHLFLTTRKLFTKEMMKEIFHEIDITELIFCVC